jgi:Natural resistance-associated macrophage protein
MPPRVGRSPPSPFGALRTVGLGLITGAADDDCSAIGTYAAAGAAVGPAFLWTAPALFPMMCAVVYLSAKLGQVAGRGLFGAIRASYPRWILYPTLLGVLIGNTIEAGADLGGMAAAVGVLVPVPFQAMVVATALVSLALQCLGSYTLIRDTFRWLALALLAYVGAALLAKPELGPVLLGTFVPTIRFTPRVPGAAGGGHRHQPVRLPVHLAVQRGGRGGDRARPHDAGPAPGGDRPGAGALAARRPGRHVLLEPDHVLHHPVDRVDAARGRRARHRLGGPGGAGAAAPRPATRPASCSRSGWWGSASWPCP